MRHFLLFCLSIFFISSAQAAPLKLEINQGSIQAAPIAIPTFIGKGSASSYASQITQVISEDLRNSGLFRPLSQGAFIEKLGGVDAMPTFSSWKTIGAQALLVGEVEPLPNGDINAKFRLWDVHSGRQYNGKAFNGSPQNWRRLAHLIADTVYQQLTGDEGYFDSRIVYISESGDPRNPTKRLAIMDQDGANHQMLTSGRYMVLSPRFDPNSQRIVYTSYYGGKPQLYVYNLQTGSEQALGSFGGMTFSPSFSPDGNSVVLAVAGQGNSEIMRLNLGNRSVKRLTNDSAIDISPSYSPDGRKIAFCSDRGGKQQLYVMSASGGRAKRISRGSGAYSTPVWSPKGDLIAFTKYKGGQFSIGVMRPDGSGERTLDSAWLVEGPTWAPNGRMVLYTKGGKSNPGRAGSSELYMANVQGTMRKRVSTQGRANDASWSPRLTSN